MGKLRKSITLLLSFMLVCGSVWGADTKAKRIRTTTTNFNNVLSATEDNVQKALDALDNLDGTFDIDTSGTGGFSELYLDDFDSGNKGIADVLNNTVNNGVLDAITITDEGGLNITWSAGVLWDTVSGATIEIDANATPTACTTDVVNYLWWDRSGAGTTLILGTTRPDFTDNDILVGLIVCQSNDIWGMHTVNILNKRESDVSVAVRDILNCVVTEGLVVSEDADATNPFDVLISAGTYYHFGVERHNLAASFNTRTTAMTRWYHTGGAWDNDTDAEIDMDEGTAGINRYDNLTNRVDGTAAKYYKSLFMYSDNLIHWIYPQAEYDTLAQALAAPLPTIPPVGNHYPRSVAVVIKGSDAAFPTAAGNRWIDIRPVFGSSILGTVVDHGSLVGLGDDDHTIYYLADGTRAMVSGQFTDADASPDAIGELVYDNTVAGFTDGLFAWYDDDEIRYLVDIATLPGDAQDDYVVAYDKDLSGFYMKTAGAGTDDQTLAEVLAEGADANDLDITSMAKLEGVDVNTYIDLDTSDTITTKGNIIPSANGADDLGTDALEFNNAWFDGTMEADTITEGGNAVYSAGEIIKNRVYISATAGLPSTTTGCADAAQVELGSTDINRINLMTCDFDASSDEYWIAHFTLPENYDGGTFTAIITWTCTADAAKGVAWFVQMLGAASGDVMGATDFGTAVEMNDDGETTNDYLQTAESGAITENHAGGSGTTVGGQELWVKVYRDISDADDDLTTDGKFIGITVIYGIDNLSTED